MSQEARATNWREAAGDWEPSPRDVRWIRDLTAIIAQGGVWTVPLCAAVIRFEHNRRTAVLVAWNGDAPAALARIRKAFIAIGWMWEDNTAEGETAKPAAQLDASR